MNDGVFSHALASSMPKLFAFSALLPIGVHHDRLDEIAGSM
jgi:hypothetical protein